MSEAVNTLTPPGELFYRRLMSVVDDFARYYASPKILRSACYPLQVDRVREADISRWIAECETAGLIVLYNVGGTDYLWLCKADPPRAKFSKFPEPPESARTCAHLIASASNGRHVRPNADTVTITKTKGGKPPNPLPLLPPELNSPQFADAFERWRKHRQEIRKPLTPTMVETQYRKFAKWGIEHSVAVIDHTIGMGWWGLREPEAKQAGGSVVTEENGFERRAPTQEDIDFAEGRT